MSLFLLVLGVLPLIFIQGTQGYDELRFQSTRNEPLDLSFYHSTDQLLDSFKDLATTCPGMTISTEKGNEKTLTSVRFRDDNDGEKMKVLMFFGEHARELISPETALKLAQIICNGGDGFDDDIKAAVQSLHQNTELLMFPLINVDGHRAVVHGKYCIRTNGHGVDLNRNWDDHWDESTASSIADTYAGQSAFSEDETVILRQSAQKFQPDMFISIHSGVLGMYTPYAYARTSPSTPVEDSMVEILNKLNPKYCDCAVGAAGKEVGYLCPGTCLDYMYDNLKTPYSFAVEIWTGGQGYRGDKITVTDNNKDSAQSNSEAGTKDTNKDNNKDSNKDNNTDNKDNNKDTDKDNNTDNKDNKDNKDGNKDDNKDNKKDNKKDSNNDSNKDSEKDSSKDSNKDSDASKDQTTSDTKDTKDSDSDSGKDSGKDKKDPSTPSLIQSNQVLKLKRRLRKNTNKIDSKSDSSSVSVSPVNPFGSCFLRAPVISLLESKQSRRIDQLLEGEGQEADSDGTLFPPPDSPESHGCLSSFNPITKQDYHDTINNWSQALISLVNEVHQAHKKLSTR